MKHVFDIETLQGLCTQAVVISYNTDAADVLSMELKPEAYALHGIQYLDRLEVIVEGRVVFSGIVQHGVGYGVQAGAGEGVHVEAHSDFSVLERVSYCRLNGAGEVVYPSVGRLSKFAKLSGLIEGYYNWAKGSGLVEAAIEVSDLLGCVVPAPEGNGFTSCAALITEAMRWVPEAVMVNRYVYGEPVMRFMQLSEAEPLTLGEDALVAAIELQAKPEDVPAFCALVGGDYYVLPEGASLQQQNGFIFPVPVNRQEEGNQVAGGSSNSQKMVVKGIALPERSVSKNCAAAYNTTSIVGDSATYKFLRYFFPKYAEYLPYCAAGACVVSVVKADDLAEDEAGETDEDAKQVPANYSEEPNNWGSGDGYDACYVLVEGSFNASSRGSKNLKGLRWCKAALSIVLSISADEYQSMPDALKPGVDELFPGRHRRQKKDGSGVYTSHKLVSLKLDCILINRRKRVYDPATNTPCSTDVEYSSEEELSASDYRVCLQRYFEASQTVWHEGSIVLLDDGTYKPEELAGRSVTIAGKRGEWAEMNAVIRSVTWNYDTKMISLNIGAVSPMAFDSLLQRRLLAKSPRREQEQSLSVPYDVRDSEAQLERETEMSVSPSISASVSGAVAGKYRQPFTLYEVFEAGEDDEDVVTVYLAGGVLKRDGQVFNVPDTPQQIVNGEAVNKGWVLGGEKLKLQWARVDRKWVYSITQNLSENDG